MASARALAKDNLRLTRQLYMLGEQLRLAREPKMARIRAESWRLRVDQERVWVDHLTAQTDHLLDSWNVLDAIHHAYAHWVVVPTPAAKRLWSYIAKDGSESTQDALPPPAHEIQATLAAGFNQEAWEAGAVQAYLGLTIETSTLSGQQSLKAMGLDKTFAWAHPQNMAQDRFAVRGSKIIQNLYGDHLTKLTDIIIQATDPRNPLTQDQVQARIAEEWPKLQSYQVERIARTEVASVWTTTAANAYQANGITQFDSIIAQGPSIGIESEDPCDECVDAAADGPFDMNSDLPPWHPNCRCEAIPVLEGEDGDPWLPPAEPWTGGDLPLADAIDAPDPSIDPEAVAQAREPHVPDPEYLEKLDHVRKRLGIVG